MQPIHVYLIVYIFPLLLLISLSTYVIVHNRKAIENRLIFISLLAFCITLLGEFARHTFPLAYNPFITMYVVGFSTMISMTTLLYLVYVIVQKHCKLPNLQFIPFIIYSVVPLHAFMVLLGVHLTSEDFRVEGIWIYREDTLYNIWLYGAVGMMSALIFYTCVYGWYHSKTAQGKQLLRFLSISSVFVFFTFFICMSVLKVQYMMPNPTMFIIFITSVILTVGVTIFDLTPSVQERYKTMFELTPTSIMLLNENFEILEINQQAKSFFYNSEETHIPSFLHTKYNIKQGIRLIHKLKKEKHIKHFQLDFQHPITLDKMLLLFDATTISFHSTYNYYIMWQDITHEAEQEKMVYHLAYHDALTSLHNRAYFVNNVKKILEEQPHQLHGFVLIDLNYFKQINDTHGHIVGDAVLQFVAATLKESVPDSALVARLGGDEFVVFYKELEAKNQLLIAIEAIRHRFLEKPFQYEELSQHISLSIGSSTFPSDGKSFEVLFHSADMSMYENKTAIKRNSVT